AAEAGRSVDPQLVQFYPGTILRQVAIQGREIDAVHLLPLIEAEEDNRLGAVLGIARSWRHCAEISFVMHCIGKLIEATPGAPARNSGSGGRGAFRRRRSSFTLSRSMVSTEARCSMSGRRGVLF